MVKDTDLTKDYYKSGEVAKMIGVGTRTIQNYCIHGLLSEIFVNKRRLIPKDSLIDFLKSKQLYVETEDHRKDIIYARVSNHKQKNRGDLERQIQTIARFAITQNPKDLEIIGEVGSGLNDTRKGLTKLITLVQEDKISRIFINYKDRLTRFGFHYLQLICDFHKTEIIIVSTETEDKTRSEELAEDIVSIIHSFSGKLYGLRKKVKEDICMELEKGTKESKNNDF